VERPTLLFAFVNLFFHRLEEANKDIDLNLPFPMAWLRSLKIVFAILDIIKSTSSHRQSSPSRTIIAVAGHEIDAAPINVRSHEGCDGHLKNFLNPAS
jgi:hypothetical protein